MDLDNLYIIDGRINIPQLRKRIKNTLEFAEQHGILRKDIWWFGNTTTGTVLEKNSIHLPMITLNNGKDAADHAILEHLASNSRRWSNAFIVSHDQSIVKVAWILFPKKSIHMVVFDDEDRCQPELIGELCFATSTSFLKMLASFVGYARRYHPNFLPSS